MKQADEKENNKKREFVFLVSSDHMAAITIDIWRESENVRGADPRIHHRRNQTSIPAQDRSSESEQRRMDCGSDSGSGLAPLIGNRAAKDQFLMPIAGMAVVAGNNRDRKDSRSCCHNTLGWWLVNTAEGISVESSIERPTAGDSNNQDAKNGTANGHARCDTA